MFSASEIAKVLDFIDVTEYGLVFDTPIDIFIEERKMITDDVLVLVGGVANAMEISAVEYVDRLRSIDRYV